MSTHDKYESRIRKAALLAGLKNGLRDGGKCLICQCWRKPCGKCARVPAKPSAGKSVEFQKAAARLGVK